MTTLITESELVSMLTEHKGASFVSVTTSTEPKLNKRHRVTRELLPFRSVRRVAIRQGMLGASYENAVNNRREREGNSEEFRAEAMWNGAGEHVSPCVIRHRSTGKLYMVLYPRQVGPEGSVVVSEDVWMADGHRVSLDTLRGFLPPVHEGAPRQETERPVAWRVIAVENINAITMHGETYTVTR